MQVLDDSGDLDDSLSDIIFGPYEAGGDERRKTLVLGVTGYLVFSTSDAHVLLTSWRYPTLYAGVLSCSFLGPMGHLMSENSNLKNEPFSTS